MDRYILAINPGSTSTKIALYNNTKLLNVNSVRHDVNELSRFKKMFDQKDYRLNIIIDFLKTNNIDINKIDVFVGRGGLLKPIKQSGVYLINEEMLEDLETEKYGTHASNLGAYLAYSLAKIKNVESYIVDPVVVDELSDISRVTGLKEIEKKSIFHALNQKKVAKMHSVLVGKKYEDLNLIVAHLGGGISIGLHKQGRVVDVNDALGGEGPFSPERSGTMPAFSLLEYYTKNNLTLDEAKNLLVGKGGLVSYLGTNSGYEIRKKIANGDNEAVFYIKAMAYQIAKEIGSLYFAAKGEVDYCILTGGLTYFKLLIDEINSYLSGLVNVYVYYGENEMEALVYGVLKVLNNEEKLHHYI